MTAAQFWWTCPLCLDRMESGRNPRRVEHDRDAHLADRHPDSDIEPALLALSRWPATR